ncbi:hypothetical protein AMATHDRAFT_72430 [Amanita thiersii Skay4041]|uniref:F-box domain-containing protein n=1 Tax=Amanita thiersii Skay4041 TaxID=703135 RepID=A0A2A9P1N3_9AGAR|nr:hypothetical protein AMATHDRAFT_72430 [Amanita thiersii Skay4041]
MTPNPLSYRFVDDLIPLVLDSNLHWWPQDLANLCRVSLAWLSFTRKRLYRHPRLTTYHTCSLLARTLHETQYLCSLIVGIILQPISSEYGDFTSRGTRLASLRTLLGVHGLQSITLGGELANGAGRFLHMVGNPSMVRELHVDGSLTIHGVTSKASLEWDESIILKFSSLHTLHLSNLDLDIDPGAPPAPMIHTLVLDNVDIIFGDLFSMANKARHIHVTTENGTEYERQLKIILDSWPVKYLKYEVRHGCCHAGSLFNQDSKPLPLLRSLHFDGVSVDRETLVWIREVCDRLEELVVTDNRVFLNAEDWATFMASESSGGLKV